LIKNFPILFALFALSRVFAALARLKFLLGTQKYYDYVHFLALARLSDQGFYPYLHYWVEYPPVFPWISMSAYRAALMVYPGFSQGTESVYYAITISIRVSSELGIFFLIHRLSSILWTSSAAGSSCLVYACLFVPFYLWTGSFDTLPALFFLLSLYYLVTKREITSSIFAAAGFLTKIFPVMIVPLAFAVIPGPSRKLRYLVLFFGILFLIMIPFLFLNKEMTLASFGVIFSRNAWETIWAMLEGNFGPGGVAPVSARIYLPGPIPGDGLASNLPLILFSVAYAAFYILFWHDRKGVEVIAAAGFSLSLLLIFSKGYSPQFLTWLAPLIAVVFPNRTGILCLSVLGAANMLECPVYFSLFRNQPVLLVFAVLLRTSALIFAAFHFFRATFGRRLANGLTMRFRA
jgi:hypothetical protein